MPLVIDLNGMYFYLKYISLNSNGRSYCKYSTELLVTFLECTRVYTVKVPWVQLRVVLLLMLFMLCKSAECFSWCTSLSTSRGEKSIIIHVFLSFIYWAQKLKKYTVSIELNWNITLFLFHGVIQFSINTITYQYLSKTSLYLTT